MYINNKSNYKNENPKMIFEDANTLLEKGYYESARELFTEIHEKINCSEKIKTCDFHLIIDEGDKLFIDKYFEEAIEQYEAAKQLKINEDLATDRILISQFCLEQRKGNILYEDLIELWQNKRYQRQAGDLTRVIVVLQKAKEIAGAIKFVDPSAKGFIKKRVGKLNEKLTFLHQALESYLERAEKLYAKKRYAEAKVLYEAINPAINCTNQIEICAYHLATQIGDEYFFNHQYEKALGEYQKILQYEPNNEGIKESEAVCKFCILEEKAVALYNELVEKWSSREKSIKLLNKVLIELQRTLKVGSQIQFVNEDAKKFVNHKITNLQDQIYNIKQGLETYMQQAHDLLSVEQYMEAKYQYEQIHPAIDCTTYLNTCDFHIALAQGDKYLAKHLYEEAFKHYEQAKSFNLAQESAEERWMLTELASSTKKGVGTYTKIEKAWKEEYQDTLLAQLQDLLSEFKDWKQQVRQLKIVKELLKKKLGETEAVIDGHIAFIEQKFQERKQIADQFFAAKDYAAAKKAYEQLTKVISCQDKIKACDFYLTFKQADKQLAEQDFETALSNYQAAAKQGLQPLVVNKRITICEFCILVEKGKEQLETGELKWSHNNSSALHDFKRGLAYLEEGQKIVPPITEEVIDFQKIISDKAKFIIEGISIVQDKMTEHFENANQLFHQKAYTEAKILYEELPPNPECLVNIKACDFYISIENTDIYLYKEQFDKAAAQYDAAKVFEINNQLIDERLAIINFCQVASKAIQKYGKQPIQEAPPKTTNKWSISKWLGFGKNPIQEEDEQKELDNQVINDLSAKLLELKEVEKLAPTLAFGNEQVQAFLQEKKQKLTKQIDTYAEHLRKYVSHADNLFAQHQYVAAREAYEKLDNAIGCETAIKKCNFYLAIQKADKLLNKQRYEAALEQYTQMRDYQVDDDLVLERLLIGKFCQLNQTANEQYEVGIANWQLEHYEVAAEELQRALANFRETKEMIVKVAPNDEHISDLVNIKLRTLTNRVADITQKLKNYEGDAHYRAAQQLFEEKKYLQARRQFEALHPVVNCAEKIKTCNFYLSIQEADSHMIEQKYDEALLQYQTARQYGIQENIITERVGLYHFCVMVKQANEFYNIGIVKWQIKNFDESVTQLENALVSLRESQKIAPDIHFGDNGIQHLLDESLKEVTQKIGDIQRKLENYTINNYYKTANEFLKEKNFIKARQELEAILELRPNFQKIVDKIEQIDTVLEEQSKPYVQRGDTLFVEAVSIKDKILAKEKFIKAKELYKKALDINPSDYIRRCVRQCGRAISRLEYGNKTSHTLKVDEGKFMNINNLYVPVPDVSKKVGGSKTEMEELIKGLENKINKKS